MLTPPLKGASMFCNPVFIVAAYAGCDAVWYQFTVACVFCTVNDSSHNANCFSFLAISSFVHYFG
jgi:hypothetical protein